MAVIASLASSGVELEQCPTLSVVGSFYRWLAGRLIFLPRGKDRSLPGNCMRRFPTRVRSPDSLPSELDGGLRGGRETGRRRQCDWRPRLAGYDARLCRRKPGCGNRPT